MRNMTVPLAFAGVAALVTAILVSIASSPVSFYAQARKWLFTKRKIYNEGRDEWSYKGGKNPAW